MQSAWLSALAFLVVSTLLGLGVLGAAKALRVRARKDSRIKHLTYECGEQPDGLAWMQFHARYYVVALFFVLFDVEAVFLFPWAVAYGGLGFYALLQAVIFIFLLFDGLVYAWRTGALKWQ